VPKAVKEIQVKVLSLVKQVSKDLKVLRALVQVL
jgi:hypothetical protein